MAIGDIYLVKPDPAWKWGEGEIIAIEFRCKGTCCPDKTARQFRFLMCKPDGWGFDHFSLTCTRGHLRKIGRVDDAV